MNEPVLGNAFHPDANNGRAAGRLKAHHGGIVFEERAEDGADFGNADLDNAALRIDLPLHGLELRLGGANDRLVFLSHPSLPEVSVYTSDHSLLEAPALLSQPSVAAQIAAVRRRKTRSRAVLAAVLTGLVAILAGMILAKDPLVAFLADRVPPGLESRLGDAVFAQMRATTPILDDAELQGHLESLTAPLLDAVGRAGDANAYTFKLHLANDPSVNAFALPGGNIVVHSGLILRAESAAEVRGVLAHEIAHVTERHSLRNILSTLGVLVLVQAILGDAGGIVAAAAEGGTYLLTLEFSRDFERQADDVGWTYLVDAGLDPRGMLTFFEKMHEDLGNSAEAQQKLAFLSTHPSSAERLERLEQRLIEPHSKGSLDLSASAAANDFALFQETLRQKAGTPESNASAPSASTDPPTHATP